MKYLNENGRALPKGNKECVFDNDVIVFFFFCFCKFLSLMKQIKKVCHPN